MKPHIELSELHHIDSLEGERTISDFDYGPQHVRDLVVAEHTLLSGRISKLVTDRLTFEAVTLQSVIVTDCVLSSSDWIDCSLNRVVFRGCKLLGANFTDNKWSSVVFDNCRIEYATFDSIHASGPAVFVDTRFKEVTFRRTDFPGGHMARCTLEDVEFDGGTYTDFDLRTTDLSTIRGAGHLNGVLIDPAQRLELAEALVSELDLHYPDDDTTSGRA
ncbi:pentapeptide repeat-containing protein [Kribbella sp. NPDC059898]|uniref:pentapeptide repeat-containing protein n=1 Tax=Kribbella sp. NPDC059898 TaxID=3346995 RepID=UPI003660FDC4